jgi:hypothetical protein
MSKGLGRLQTDVLGLMLARPGGDEIPAYWAQSHRVVKLADGFHDMRGISHDLENLQDSQRGWYPRFSRAVRTLERRGLIEFPRWSYLSLDTEPDAGIMFLADGVSLARRGNDSRRRFGRVRGISEKCLNAYKRGRELVERIAEYERLQDARLNAWCEWATGHRR